MDKNDIRILYKVIRRTVTEREEKERMIFNKLFKVARRPQSVFCYESIGGEVSTEKIIIHFSEFAQVYVPEVCGKEMKIKSYNADKYTDNAPELTIVPLIAFDETLNRVGFGGGYYDRYLAKYKTSAVGIAFDEQQCDPFEKEVTDIPLDMIITPTRILKIN